MSSTIWQIVSVAVLGSFLSQLDATIVNVSLSSLALDLHSSLAAIQWVTSGYLLALTLVLPLNGWLVDRIGAKALYLYCFTSFTLSSALCGLAWSTDSLIAFRVFQGVSGGLLAPMAQMMIARAAGNQMARYMGYATLPILLAPLLGPVIAGAILHFTSWRWLFLVNLPVGAVAVLLASRFLPDDREETRRRPLDWAGLLLLSPAVVLFLYALNHIGDRTGFLAVAAAGIFLVSFIRSGARKGDEALIDLRLFQGKTFSAASVTAFLSNGVSYAGQMLIPIYLIRACGRSPAAMGWLMVPLALGMMCSYPAMGVLTKRFGVRRLSATGALVGLVGTLPFLYLASQGLSLIVLAVALFLRGVGQGGIGIPAMSAAYAAVERQDLPMAATALNIVQRLGGPTLTTLCATFLAWRLNLGPAQAGVVGPYAAAFVLLCVLHAVLFGATLRLPLVIGGERVGKPLIDGGQGGN